MTSIKSLNFKFFKLKNYMKNLSLGILLNTKTCVLRRNKTCSSNVGFSKYQSNKKLLYCLILNKVTRDITIFESNIQCLWKQDIRSERERRPNEVLEILNKCIVFLK